MTKLKTRAHLACLSELDWPSHEPITLTELIAGARTVDWDFTSWCYASDITLSDFGLLWELSNLLAYASRREGRAGLH